MVVLFVYWAYAFLWILVQTTYPLYKIISWIAKLQSFGISTKFLLSGLIGLIVDLSSNGGSKWGGFTKNRI